MRAAVEGTAALAAKVLIVNADDLGLSVGVNRGIVVSHRQGVVTSASLMTNLDAFLDAVAAARECPDLGIGIHLTMTCGHPLTPLPKPLRGKHGGFVRPARLLIAVAMSERLRGALRAELSCQIERALGVGIHVTHLDTHHNLHLFPAVRRCVDEVAAQFGIPWVRFRRQMPLASINSSGRGLGRLRNRAKLSLASLLNGHVADAGSRRIFGAPQLETESIEDTLADVISALPPGITEIACHPGHLDGEAMRIDPRGRTRELELDALIGNRLKRLVREHGVRLANYAELDPAG
jgi:predicted glycoside hydrolase/deacetylase ChbG (UPF0249 family)